MSSILCSYLGYGQEWTYLCTLCHKYSPYLDPVTISMSVYVLVNVYCVLEFLLSGIAVLDIFINLTLYLLVCSWTSLNFT